MKNELDNTIMIDVDSISITFNLAKERTDTLKEYCLKLLKNQLKYQEFNALSDVSFTVKKGESLGLIGENGCGKSTLLKTIAGVYAPTKGRVTLYGNVAPLIELGAGFDMDLTARENIYLNGAILGYSHQMMESYFDSIMNFSELWEFVDVPLKNYSSGMVARLGFSIATIVKADILIVDEILAVGDLLFQKKCHERMEEMMNDGATLLFVSHDLEQIKKLCQRAIWIEHGRIKKMGDSYSVCEAYVEELSSRK